MKPMLVSSAMEVSWLKIQNHQVGSCGPSGNASFCTQRDSQGSFLAPASRKYGMKRTTQFMNVDKACCRCIYVCPALCWLLVHAFLNRLKAAQRPQGTSWTTSSLTGFTTMEAGVSQYLRCLASTNHIGSRFWDWDPQMLDTACGSSADSSGACGTRAKYAQKPS